VNAQNLLIQLDAESARPVVRIADFGSAVGTL
jgi:hypothetical protein